MRLPNDYILPALLETNNPNVAAKTSLLTADDGFSVSRLAEAARRADATYDSRAYEAQGRLLDYLERPRDYRREFRLKEAMTTSDFPLMFSDTLNRALQGEYQVALEQMRADWRQYLGVARVKDFRDKYTYAFSGGDAALDPLTETGEYKERALSESESKYRVGKYGNRMAFSFEVFLQDDLDAFANTPRLLARGGVRRELRFATGLFVDANGPHSSLYTVGNDNIIAGNPPLGPDGFEAGMAKLQGQVNAAGEPIIIDSVHLVIPPALEPLANRMFVEDGEWELTVGGTTVRKRNPYRGRVRVHVNPYITVLATTANGASSWFLMADPNNGSPVAEVGFLAGHEEPELFILEPNARRIGGGTNLADGDFFTDTLQNKVRMFIGGTRVDPNMTVSSNGSNA